MSVRLVLLALLVWSVIASGTPANAQNQAGGAPKKSSGPATPELKKGQRETTAEAPKPAGLALGRVASEETLIFLTSNGWKTPDPKSKNKTELLFAEPSIQEYFRQLVSEVKKAINSQIRESDQEAQVLSQAIPVLLSAAIEHPLAISLERFEINFGGAVGPMQPVVKFAAVIDAGSDEEKVREAFESLIDLSPEDGPNALAEETIDGATLYHPQQDPQSIVPRFGMFKSYLIFTLGAGTAKETIERLSGDDQNSKWLDSSLTELKIERPSAALHIDFKKIWEASKPLIQAPVVRGVLDATGLLDLKRVDLVAGLDPVFSASKAVIETNGPPKGLLALLPDKPLTAADLKGIPANPMQAHIVRFDLENLVEVALKIAEQFNPGIRNQYEGTSAQLENVVGFSFQNDFLKAFGDVWSLYIAGRSQGASVPEIILTISIRDAKKMTKVHDAMIDRAKQILNQRGPFQQNATLEEFKAKQNKGFELHVNGVSVAWILTADHFVVGPNADFVTAHVDRSEEKESLADNPEVQAAMKRDPKTVLISYHDPKLEVQAIYEIINQFSPLLMMGLRNQRIDFDMPDLPPIEDLQRHLAPSVSTFSRTSNGWRNESQGVVPSISSASPMIAAVGAALLLPAITEERIAVRRIQSKNNLKQLGLAMHNYHDVWARFPEQASKDKKDKPLLSWRVKMLPYIDQAALYNEFHHDEPWNSEHNKKLIERMPPTFASPDSPELAKEFKTRYVVAVGKGTLFDGDEGPRLRDVTDGTSNTIMILEAHPDSAVVWTEPDDLEIDFDDPLNGLVGNGTGGFHILLADGSVRFISDFIDLATFKALLTKAGGEVVGDF